MSCKIKGQDKSSVNQIITCIILSIISSKAHKNSSLIYILVWEESSYNSPFSFIEWGLDAFINRNCTFQNCYLTRDSTYFDDILDYDAIMFNAWYIKNRHFRAPNKRSHTQVYIFVATEPSKFSMLLKKFDGFFNMTWTYKLDSDVPFPYIVVRNKSTGEEIGPSRNMEWMDIKEMEPTSPEIISKLSTKSKAAVWMVSKCHPAERLILFRRLTKELDKYGFYIDVFGKCGTTVCPLWNTTPCHEVIEKDYYFYMAMENSFSDDYMTEKILHGLNHYAVPVVYGGADYRRFMPDGIYLNARELGVGGLAEEMNNIIHDKRRYYDFFRWHKYYEFQSNEKENNLVSTVCGLCALLNKRIRGKQTKVINNITRWWNNNWEGVKRVALKYVPDDIPKTVTTEVAVTEKGVIAEFFSPVASFFGDLLNHFS